MTTRKIVSSFILLLSFTIGCKEEENINDSAKKIVVEIRYSSGNSYEKGENSILKGNQEIQYFPINHVENPVKRKSAKANLVDGKIKWILYSDGPIQIRYALGALRMVNPGDSIHIDFNRKGHEFSGQGADKLKMWDQISQVENKMPVPTKNNFTVNSLNDYLKWNQYADSMLTLQLPIIDSFRNKIPTFDYDYLKAAIVSAAERDRIHAFAALQNYCKTDESCPLTSEDFVAIWDSTQHKPWNNWLQSLSTYYSDIYNIYAFNRMEVQRKFRFDFNNDSLKSKEIRTHLYYLSAKLNYKGLLRERLMAYILDEPTITEMGLDNPMTQAMLKDYYSQPEFPEYKQYVKKLENKAK